jgi:ribonuclease I
MRALATVVVAAAALCAPGGSVSAAHTDRHHQLRSASLASSSSSAVLDARSEVEVGALGKPKATKGLFSFLMSNSWAPGSCLVAENRLKKPNGQPTLGQLTQAVVAALVPVVACGANGVLALNLQQACADAATAARTAVAHSRDTALAGGASAAVTTQRDAIAAALITANNFLVRHAGPVGDVATLDAAVGALQVRLAAIAGNAIIGVCNGLGKQFGVHGLWPSDNSYNYLDQSIRNCAGQPPGGGKPANAGALATVLARKNVLQQKLDAHWKTLVTNGNTDADFRFHEYEAHGTCMPSVTIGRTHTDFDGPVPYFTAAMVTFESKKVANGRRKFATYSASGAEPSVKAVWTTKRNAAATAANQLAAGAGGVNSGQRNAAALDALAHFHHSKSNLRSLVELQKQADESWGGLRVYLHCSNVQGTLKPTLADLDAVPGGGVALNPGASFHVNPAFDVKVVKFQVLDEVQLCITSPEKQPTGRHAFTPALISCPEMVYGTASCTDEYIWVA